MARAGWSASTNYLRYGAAVLTAAPLTIAAWAWTSVVGGGALAQSIVDLHLAASAQNRNQFRLMLGVTDSIVQAVTSDASATSSASAAAPTASTWFHAAAVFASATDRRAFLNGGNKGTNSGNRTPTGIDEIVLGVQGGTTQNTPFGTASGTGYIAEVGIWNVALTDAEVAVLALGVSPLLVSPGALVAYWPLIGRYSPEINLKSNTAVLSMTGTVSQAAHCRVFLPRVRMPWSYHSVHAGSDWIWGAGFASRSRPWLRTIQRRRGVGYP